MDVFLGSLNRVSGEWAAGSVRARLLARPTQTLEAKGNLSKTIEPITGQVREWMSRAGWRNSSWACSRSTSSATRARMGAYYMGAYWDGAERRSGLLYTLLINSTPQAVLLSCRTVARVHSR